MRKRKLRRELQKRLDQYHLQDSTLRAQWQEYHKKHIIAGYNNHRQLEKIEEEAKAAGLQVKGTKVL